MGILSLNTLGYSLYVSSFVQLKVAERPLTSHYEAKKPYRRVPQLLGMIVLHEFVLEILFRSGNRDST